MKALCPWNNGTFVPGDIGVSFLRAGSPERRVRNEMGRRGQTKPHTRARGGIRTHSRQQFWRRSEALDYYNPRLSIKTISLLHEGLTAGFFALVINVVRLESCINNMFCFVWISSLQ